MTTIQTLESLLLAVAEKLSLPCAVCVGSGKRFVNTAATASESLRCLACSGAGNVYPLRQECWVGNVAKHEEHRNVYGPETSCIHCDMRAWVPVALRDSTLDAAAFACGITIQVSTTSYRHPVVTASSKVAVKTAWVEFDPTSAESRTRARLQAILKVLG